MEITPNELRDVEIPTAFRGFDQNEVHELLDRAADTIEALQARVRQLSAAAAEATPPVAPAAPAESATAAAARTLELAQRVADETVDEAKAKADEIIADGEARSRSLVAEAEAEVTRLETEQRLRIESEIAELDGRRGELEREVGDLEAFERSYRDRMLSLVRDDLERLEQREVPGETKAEDSPPADTQIDTQIDTPIDRGTTELDDSLDTRNATDADAATDVGGPATETVTIESGLTGSALSEPRASEPEPTPLIAPLIGSATDPTPLPTIDLAQEQAAEREALEQLVSDDVDDDDFFTSLREATSETAATGTADERLFETDDERDSTFRDVFRRRR